GRDAPRSMALRWYQSVEMRLRDSCEVAQAAKKRDSSMSAASMSRRPPSKTADWMCVSAGKLPWLFAPAIEGAMENICAAAGVRESPPGQRKRGASQGCFGEG